MPAPDFVTSLMAACCYQGGAGIAEQYSRPWLELCRRSADHTPFGRPEWTSAYLHAFEPAGAAVLAVAEQDGQWQALLPLIHKRTSFCGLPARMYRGAANEHSSRFDLVRAAGEDGDAGVREIWELLKAKSDWDLIELPYVPEGGAVELLLDLAARDGFLTGQYESYRSPYISLQPTEVAGNIPASAHFRQNLRRRMRKARGNWEVRLRRVDNPDAQELSRFYELEGSGWKGKGQTAIASSERTRRFYDEIAGAASRCGYFSLYLLEFGDRLVAGHFGLTYEGCYYCPKVAYDETQSAYGPGHLIIEAILADILRQGCREFDFLGPSMDWKQEWARGGRRHSFCYVFQPGPHGRILHAAKFKVATALRAAVHRLRALRR